LYAAAAGVLVLLVAIAELATRAIPRDVLQNSHVNTSEIQGLALTPGLVAAVLLQQALLVALGEELFFRGLLGGWLNRRLGFGLGNLLQATIFLGPHLLLLAVSLRVWPILPVQWAAGWLLGWLRYRSDSIVPGWMVHTLMNTIAIVVFGGLT